MASYPSEDVGYKHGATTASHLNVNLYLGATSQDLTHHFPRGARGQVRRMSLEETKAALRRIIDFYVSPTVGTSLGRRIVECAKHQCDHCWTDLFWRWLAGLHSLFWEHLAAISIESRQVPGRHSGVLRGFVQDLWGVQSRRWGACGREAHIGFWTNWEGFSTSLKTLKLKSGSWSWCIEMAWFIPFLFPPVSSFLTVFLSNASASWRLQLEALPEVQNRYLTASEVKALRQMAEVVDAQVATWMHQTETIWCRDRFLPRLGSLIKHWSC